MRFIDPTDDPWKPLGPEGSPGDRQLLTLPQWLAVRPHWPAGARAGVLIDNDADIAALAGALSGGDSPPALLALQFPKWTDGRAYTQARLLRTRYAFGGEIRAVGEVLVDMLPLLQRCGFDAVCLRADQKIAHAERALQRFGAHYQGDAVQPQPLFARSAA